jgi:adenylyl-sulfate kinase
MVESRGTRSGEGGGVAVASAAQQHQGFVLWFTGLSGAGKSTLATRVAGVFAARGYRVEVLDGDEVRTHLSKGLGFSKEDRDTNVRRIGFVARLLARHGVIAITAAISPYADVRAEMRAAAEAADVPFVEVYVSCPVSVLAERDVKGLYKKALAGEIEHFTGVSDPYEPPTNPDVLVESDKETPLDGENKILSLLASRGLIEPAR